MVSCYKITIENIIKQCKALGFNQDAIDYNVNIYLEKIKKTRKRYYELNKEKIKQYREDNKELRKQYMIKNKDKFNKMKLERCNIRRKTDLNFKILSDLRTRIRIAIKKGYKSAHTKELLGCSIDECRAHLQKQFKDGMSWANMGKWHIDHIKPCCSFDLTKPEEQRACFHYSNLQPLWAEENIRKGGKI